MVLVLLWRYAANAEQVFDESSLRESEYLFDCTVQICLIAEMGFELF